MAVSDVFGSEDFIKSDSVPNLISKIILVKRLYVSDSIEAYRREIFQGVRANPYEIRTRLANLFDDITPYLEVSLEKEVFYDLKRLVFNGGVAELLEAWDFINKFLFEKGLLNILKQEVIL
jgi:hypothetical protein